MVLSFQPMIILSFPIQNFDSALNFSTRASLFSITSAEVAILSLTDFSVAELPRRSHLGLTPRGGKVSSQ